ncbi:MULTISPECIES: hypothetical protein [Cobetia]|uniref:hypothetical protein n=1 Tax=Cobetia TaxID=204286 RepID=UPI000468C3F4|nr:MULTISPECIES: hypothetical protein [Cobetia]
MSIHPLNRHHDPMPAERRATLPTPYDPGPMALPHSSAWHGLIIGTGLALLCAALVVAGVYSARASMPMHGLNVVGLEQALVTQPSEKRPQWQASRHMIPASLSNSPREAPPRSLFM